MRFLELPESSYFVVVKSEEISLLLAKSVGGIIRFASSWLPTGEIGITPKTEVQQVELKKSC